MTDQPSNTTIISDLLLALKRGDESARDELIKHSFDRVQQISRRELRRFPGVKRWNETDDVTQRALMRLDNALRKVTPESKERLLGLAARHVRFAVIDIHRSFYGPEGAAKNHDTDPGLREDGKPAFEKTAVTSDPSTKLAVHEAVETLPTDLREVFDRRFYLEMTHDEIAVELGVSSKTSKRRWRDAKIQLAELLGMGDDD